MAAFIPAVPLTFSARTSSLHGRSARTSRPCVAARRHATTHTVRATAAPTTAISSSKPTTVTYTSLDNNGFVLRYGDLTVVVDPWLYGDLIFGNSSVYQMGKQSPASPASDVSKFPIDTIDALLLTQGLEDHAHPPTLEKLRKDIPVFAAPAAKPLLQSLGYSNVTYLKHGSTNDVLPGVTLTALQGARVGPPWSERQIALLLQFDAGCSLYHEPHGEHVWPDLPKPVDVAIAPYINAYIAAPNGGPKILDLVYGIDSLVKLCRTVQPKACVAFDNSRGENPSGFLVDFINGAGSVDDLRQAFNANTDLTDVKLIVGQQPMEEIVVWCAEQEAEEKTTVGASGSSAEVGQSLGQTFSTA